MKMFIFSSVIILYLVVVLAMCKAASNADKKMDEWYKNYKEESEKEKN